MKTLATLMLTSLLTCAAVPTLAAAQTPPVTGRALTVDEAVAIALASQPEIKARVKDYEAARFKVDEALAALLPQVTGASTATKSQNVIVQTSPQTGVTSIFTSTREFQQTFNAQ